MNIYYIILYCIVLYYIILFQCLGQSVLANWLPVPERLGGNIAGGTSLVGAKANCTLGID